MKILSLIQMELNRGSYTVSYIEKMALRLNGLMGIKNGGLTDVIVWLCNKRWVRTEMRYESNDIHHFYVNFMDAINDEYRMENDMKKTYPRPKVCSKCKANLLKPNSVKREHKSKEGKPSIFDKGELNPTTECFHFSALVDGRFYTLDEDNCDTCVACGHVLWYPLYYKIMKGDI